MRRLLLELACVLCAVTAGCSDKGSSAGGGGGSGGGAAKPASERLDAAQAACDEKNWKGALAELDLVIADSKATGEEKAQAWADKVFCEAQANGDEAAKAALHRAVDAEAELTVLQCFKLGTELADAGKSDAALEVVAVATKKFEGDPDAKKKLKKLASYLRSKGGDSSKLDALGYTGSNADDEE